MDISLQPAEDIFERYGQRGIYERAILNVLKATLQYPATPRLKAEKLADDISFFCQEEDTGIILWSVWFVVIEIAGCIPPDHPWQQCLLQALDILRHRNDTTINKEDTRRWEELPYLSMAMREKWFSPVGYCTGEELDRKAVQWKNLNSFVARFTRLGFAPWLNLPIWELREALEEPTTKGLEMECLLWVATEWMIQCADIIFNWMTSVEELDQGSARALRGGPLCRDIAPLSVERWEFWKERLVALAADAENLEVDSAIVARITEALESMGAVKDSDKLPENDHTASELAESGEPKEESREEAGQEQESRQQESTEQQRRESG